MARRYASQKVDKAGYPLRSDHFEAIRELRRDHVIVITRPDKGNGVVLLKHEDYLSKMDQILSQQDKFDKIDDAEENNSTLKQKRAIQAFLLRVLHNGHISRETYD